MDSVSIAAEICRNPQALPELLERAGAEVETALAAAENMPAAVWALADVCEFLEGLAEGVAFASERGSLVAQTFFRCFNESANVPDLRATARHLRRIGGPTPEARRFPDKVRDFAEFLRRWLRVQALLTAPPTTPARLTEEVDSGELVTYKQLASHAEVSHVAVSDRIRAAGIQPLPGHKNKAHRFRYADVLPILRQWAYDTRSHNTGSVVWPENPRQLKVSSKLSAKLSPKPKPRKRQ